MLQRIGRVLQIISHVHLIQLIRSWRNCTGYVPLDVTLWLTYRCNARCRFCMFASDKFRTELPKIGELSSEQIRCVLDDLATLGTKRVMITGGEPAIRKDIRDIVSYAAHHGIRVGIFTNGGLLTQSLVDNLVTSGIDTICVSLDSVDTAVHDSLRGLPGLGERALAALRYVDESRRRLERKVKLVTNTVVTRLNYENIDRIAELKQDIDLDHATFASLIEYELAPDHDLQLRAEDRGRLVDQVIPRLYEKAQRYGLAVSVPAGETPGVPYQDTYCFLPWFYAEILPNGNVIACGKGGASGLQFGNVTQESFRDIWNGKKFVAFRRVCRPPQLDMCRDCTCRLEYNQQLMRVYGLVPKIARPFLEGS